MTQRSAAYEILYNTSGKTSCKTSGNLARIDIHCLFDAHSQPFDQRLGIPYGTFQRNIESVGLSQPHHPECCSINLTYRCHERVSLEIIKRHDVVLSDVSVAQSNGFYIWNVFKPFQKCRVIPCVAICLSGKEKHILAVPSQRSILEFHVGQSQSDGHHHKDYSDD